MREGKIEAEANRTEVEVFRSERELRMEKVRGEYELGPMFLEGATHGLSGVVLYDIVCNTPDDYEVPDEGVSVGYDYRRWCACGRRYVYRELLFTVRKTDLYQVGYTKMRVNVVETPVDVTFAMNLVVEIPSWQWSRTNPYYRAILMDQCPNNVSSVRVVEFWEMLCTVSHAKTASFPNAVRTLLPMFKRIPHELIPLLKETYDAFQKSGF